MQLIITTHDLALIPNWKLWGDISALDLAKEEILQSKVTWYWWKLCKIYRLLTQCTICNGKSADGIWKYKVYWSINHDVFIRAKACDSNGRKLTANKIKNVQSLHNFVRTDQAYKLLKNWLVESGTATLPCVGIGDARIIVQWHLLVIRAD